SNRCCRRERDGTSSAEAVGISRCVPGRPDISLNILVVLCPGTIWAMDHIVAGHRGSSCPLPVPNCRGPPCRHVSPLRSSASCSTSRRSVTYRFSTSCCLALLSERSLRVDRVGSRRPGISSDTQHRTVPSGG